jgi:hypothetical protein
VLTTFTILADMAQMVAGDQVGGRIDYADGAEIHGYEPTPSDLVKAQDADLILYNGMNLERWFEQFLGNVQDVPAVILTDGIEPIPIAEGPYADKPNPHAWMSPQNALIYVENIRQAFVDWILTMQRLTTPMPPPTVTSSERSTNSYKPTLPNCPKASATWSVAKGRFLTWRGTMA